MGRRTRIQAVTLAVLLTACAGGATTSTPTETLPGSAEPPTQSTAATVPGSTTEFPPPSTVDVPEGELARVTEVFDGDSFVVSLADRSEEVRMIGINAPEGSECYGDEARDTLRSLIDGKQITLVGAGEDDRDRFGRLLRFVYADGVFINQEMARTGNAVVFQSGQPREAEFKALEDEAFDAGRGMWEIGVCGDQGRADVLILAVEYDPPGRDFENLDEEFVGLGNAGTSTIDLSRWTLRDETSQHRYVFPDGFVLEVDGIVRVRVGCGNDDADDLYWCKDDAVWSNGGDTALLQDANGNIVDRFVYEGEY
jgi:micrococcal nuclease